jgi:hypothetical protein
VVLEARREVEIRHLDVSISGHGRVGVDESFWLGALSYRLCGRTRLGLGRTAFPLRLALPANLTPSYEGRTVEASYRLHIRARVPWWLDSRASCRIRLLAPPLAQGQVRVGRPRVFSSAPQGPAGGEPHMEVSLASDVVAPGEILHGAVAVSSPASRGSAVVEMSLICCESARTGQTWTEAQIDGYLFTIPVRDPAGGGHETFALQVPREVRPSVATDFWQLRWFLEVRVPHARAAGLRFRCPLTIAPPHLAPATRAITAPAVGSPRLQAIWKRAAAASGMSFAGGALQGQVEDVTVELRRQPGRARGAFLVGELRYPSLNLGLELRTRRRWLRGRQTEVDGRERAQVEPIGEALLRHCPPRATVDAGDSQATFDVRGPGQQSETLARLAESLMEAARALVAARAQVPPPAAMAEGVDSWRRLAARLGGRLNLGGMTAAGTFAGKPAVVATVFDLDGRPLRTTVTLRAPFQLRSEPGWPERYLVDGELLRVDLPAPLLDVAPALEALSEMALLCDRPATGGGGAYR